MRAHTLFPLLLLPLISAAPMPSAGIDPSDSVLLLDAPVIQTGPTAWDAQVRAFVYQRQSSTDYLVMSFIGLRVDGVLRHLSVLSERLSLFAAVPLHNQEVTVSVTGCSLGARTLGARTPASGMLEAAVPACEGARGIRAELGPNDRRELAARAYPSPPTGWGVVSDIDDTIKESGTLAGARTLLANTFVKPSRAVGGMAALYGALDARLGAPAWAYLSASPFQLQPMLRAFLDAERFPGGPLLLRNLTLTDIDDLVDFVRGGGTEAYKTAQIDKIHAWFPGKRYLLVGDSTQKDPEVYGAAATRFGDWVGCVWIRLVEGGDNTELRFDTAFKGLDKAKWRLFKDPKELDGLDVKGGVC